MITGKIDVTKIRKDRLYVGKKGTYLNIILIPTPKSEYGDYMIKENISKEARDAGEDGTILGNASIQKWDEKPGETQEEGLPF